MMQNDPASPARTEEMRLNLQEFARQQGTVEGWFAVPDLPRLSSSLMGTSASLNSLRANWSLRGSMRQRAGQPDQAMLELTVQAVLPMQCQRCLQGSLQEVHDTVLFRLVEKEPELTLDELESEEEALCVRGATDIRALVEDQLILALPLVPMHEVCPQPIVAEGLQNRTSEAQAPGTRESPFAALARLKKPS